MSDSPIVVLVHGAWHGAWCWAALQSELDSRGIASLAVDLPGHGASIEPLGDLYGDAGLVAKLVDRIDAPVVLVGHSYGGAVISEASTRTAGQGGVAHLVYVTAFVPEVGESVISMTKSMPAAETGLAGAMVIGSGMSTIDHAFAPAVFYGLSDPLPVAASVARLGQQPLSAFTQTLTGAGWKGIESTFVRCTRDDAIHIRHQDLMAGRCTNIETLDSDHSPFLSKPAELAEIIVRVVALVQR